MHYFPASLMECMRESVNNSNSHNRSSITDISENSELQFELVYPFYMKLDVWQLNLCKKKSFASFAWDFVWSVDMISAAKLSNSI